MIDSIKNKFSDGRFSYLIQRMQIRKNPKMNSLNLNAMLSKALRIPRLSNTVYSRNRSGVIKPQK